MGFDLLVDVTGIHFLEREYSYEVVYHLLSLGRRRRLRLRTRLGEAGEIDSVTSIWRGADWHEREAFDLVGIRFKGHPDLRRRERQALKCSLNANSRHNFNLLETSYLIRVGLQVLRKAIASCCTL
jgi:NADH:ubiquinone oxidoreductase subunit C